MIGDILYFHQVLKQPDASSFEQAVNEHVDNKYWELINHYDVPQNVEIVSSVWAMHHKCNLTTKNHSVQGKIKIHVGKQIYGINNLETYASVVTWFAVRLLISSNGH